MTGLGLTDATRRVAEHARSLVRLELQLATAELKAKLAALGTGIGLVLFAALFLFFTLAFVYLRKGANVVPEQAIAEAQATTEALRNGDRV
jgi:hypothetical protein